MMTHKPGSGSNYDMDLSELNALLQGNPRTVSLRTLNLGAAGSLQIAEPGYGFALFGYTQAASGTLVPAKWLLTFSPITTTYGFDWYYPDLGLFWSASYTSNGSVQNARDGIQAAMLAATTTVNGVTYKASDYITMNQDGTAPSNGDNVLGLPGFTLLMNKHFTSNPAWQGLALVNQASGNARPFPVKNSEAFAWVAVDSDGFDPAHNFPCKSGRGFHGMFSRLSLSWPADPNFANSLGAFVIFKTPRMPWLGGQEST